MQATNAGGSPSPRTTKIAATKWHAGGIATAIEAGSSDASRYTYYWATMNKWGLGGTLEKPVCAAFLANRESEHQVSIIPNPGSDNLRIQLMRHRPTPEKDPIVGYFFHHACAVDAGFRGTLYELRATKVDLGK